MVMVTTASGQRQRFNPKKIYRTCIRAGASRGLASEIVREVEERLYDGIPTRKILQMVLDAMERRQATDVASRYDLKSAMMRMGPAGFAFETFVAEVFRQYGHGALLRQHIQGRCVMHEVDIVLEKDGLRTMVEVKYHNAPGIYTGLKEAMYTYSRYLDLREGYEAGTCQRFDKALLATNTRSSFEARKYALCKGIELLGWKYPAKAGLEKMIEAKCLYPVTVLRTDRRSLAALSRADLVLARDLAVKDPGHISEMTGLPRGRVEQLSIQAKSLLDATLRPECKT